MNVKVTLFNIFEFIIQRNSCNIQREHLSNSAGINVPQLKENPNFPGKRCRHPSSGLSHTVINVYGEIKICLATSLLCTHNFIESSTLFMVGILNLLS